MYNLQDPDIRVLYTRQPISGTKVNQLLNTLSSSEDTGQPLPMPPRIQITNEGKDTSGMDVVEGQTVCKGGREQARTTKAAAMKDLHPLCKQKLVHFALPSPSLHITIE